MRKIIGIRYECIVDGCKNWEEHVVPSGRTTLQRHEVFCLKHEFAPYMKAIFIYDKPEAEKEEERQ